MRNYKKMAILFFIVTLLHTGIRYSQACLPALPDPWFISKLTFNDNLPHGVKIIKTENGAYQSFELKNDTSIPFYLGKKDESEGFYSHNSELPPDVRPIAKIVSGVKYNYDFTKGWVKDSYPMTDGSTVTNSSITLDLRLSDYKEKDMKFGDNRPSNEQPPASEDFIILAYYQGKLLPIKGTVGYSLNPNYSSDSVEQTSHACDDWNNANTVLGYRLLNLLNPLNIVIAIIILGGMGYLIIKRRNRRI